MVVKNAIMMMTVAIVVIISFPMVPQMLLARIVTPTITTNNY